LSRIPDTYYTDNDYTEHVPEGVSKFKWGLQQATERAEKSGSFKDQIKQGTEVFLGIAFVLIPQVMAIGTVALIVAEYTPYFEIISKNGVYSATNNATVPIAITCGMRTK